MRYFNYQLSLTCFTCCCTNISVSTLSVLLKEKFASFAINTGQEIAVCVTNCYYYPCDMLLKQKRTGLLLIIIGVWLLWCRDGCVTVAFGI